MAVIQFIIRVDDSKLLDNRAMLRLEVIDWLEQMGGGLKCDRRSVHFITNPPHWWYERHPRNDIGITTMTEKALQAEQTWDVFSFADPTLAMMFKLAWL